MQRAPKAVAAESGDGAKQRARGRRVVSNVELVILEDAEEVAAVVAERLARATREGGNVVLTGGTTPEQAYREAAKRAPDWSKVDVWFGDERCVPPDHEHSNFLMAKLALLDRLDVAPKAVHRMKGELGKEAGAADYERELGDTRLDLLLLGLGSDGHIASLFPDRPEILITDRVAVAVRDSPKPPPERVTLTRPVINGSRRVWLVLAGTDKAAALGLALAGASYASVPAAGAKGRRRTIFFVDDAAASQVPPELIDQEY